MSKLISQKKKIEQTYIIPVGKNSKNIPSEEKKAVVKTDRAGCGETTAVS